MRHREGRDDLDDRPQAARPQHNRDQERDVVVAEEDMLDARVDIAKDDVEQRRRRCRDFDFGLRRVQQSLRRIRLWPDQHDLLGARLNIDENRRLIDQVALEAASRAPSTSPDCGSNTLVPATRSMSLPLSATSRWTVRSGFSSMRALDRLI